MSVCGAELPSEKRGMLAFSVNFVTSFGYNGSEFFKERVKGIAMLSVGEGFV